MGIYRKIEISMWGDERFRSLTPIHPSGQALWIYLLTGPHSTTIPGLFKAGRASMAEDLGWDVKGFDEAFEEVFREGLAKADMKARLIWLPKALKHNQPANPNVVKSWVKQIQLLPQCDLLKEALLSMHNEIKGFGKGFHEGFGKGFEEGVANTQYTIHNTVTQEKILSSKLDGASFHWEVLDYLNQKTGRQYKRVQAHSNRIKARIKEGYSLEDFKKVIDFKVSEWTGKDDFEKYLRPETLFGTKFDSYLAESGKAIAQESRGSAPSSNEAKVDELLRMRREALGQS